MRVENFRSLTAPIDIFHLDRMTKNIYNYIK